MMLVEVVFVVLVGPSDINSMYVQNTLKYKQLQFSGLRLVVSFLQGCFGCFPGWGHG